MDPVINTGTCKRRVSHYQVPVHDAGSIAAHAHAEISHTFQSKLGQSAKVPITMVTEYILFYAIGIRRTLSLTTLHIGSLTIAAISFFKGPGQ